MGIISSLFGGKPKRSNVQSQVQRDTSAADREADEKRRRVALNQQGAKATTLTSPLGDTSAASTLKPKLGGG